MAGPGDPLTEYEFWDEFWAPVRLPTEVDEQGLFERVFLPILDRLMTERRPQRALEIGCAPGRWLAHLQQRYGTDVTGVDSSPEGMAMARRNLEMLGVPVRLIEADVFSDDVSGGFDLVYSLGVIEHFAKPQAIVDRHVELVAPGGMVLVEVPVLTGVTGWALRRTGSTLLDHHNTGVMSPGALEGLLRSAGAAPIAAGYVGGFDPSFLDLQGRPAYERAVLSAVGRVRRRLRITDRVGGRHLSGYCYAVATCTG